MIKNLPLLITAFFVICASLGFAQCNTSAVNLIPNGNFEGEDTTFTIKNYIRLPLCRYSSPGTFQISNNNCNGTGRSTFNTPVFDGIFDHTSGSGKFLMIDPQTPGDIIWQHKVNVIPQKQYQFTVWTRELDKQNNNAILKLGILSDNGKLIASGDEVLLDTLWKPYTFIFNSDTNVSVNFRLIDIQANINIGNDLGLDDFSFVEYCDPTSVAPSSDNGLHIYPNPFIEEVNYSLPYSGQMQKVQLLNVNGTVLAEDHVHSINGKFNTGYLPSGIYFIKMINSNTTVTGKIVKY